MKQYIGSKIVNACRAYRCTLPGGEVVYEVVYDAEGNIVCSGCKIEDGYRVQYEDGYLSWCPKNAFEKAYRETTGLSFGLAIEAAKMGKKIARAGWNGKNQYVELACCISYKNHDAEIVNVNHCNIGNKAFAFVGTSGVQMGWLASQADMLADDWQIVE